MKISILKQSTYTLVNLIFCYLVLTAIFVGAVFYSEKSIGFIGGAFLFAIDDYSFFGVYGFLLGGLINLLLACLAIYFIFASIFYVLRINKAKFLTSLLSCFILTVSLGVSVGLQFAKLDFYWRLPGYNSIIQLIRDGELMPDHYGNYKYIDVDVVSYSDEQSFFFHNSGASIQGYLYSSTNKIPESLKCRKIADQESWFDCINP